MKDRVWGFASFAPSYFDLFRTVNFTAPNGTRSLQQNQEIIPSRSLSRWAA